MEPNNQIEEIKEKIDIVQIVEKYVKLKQTGKNFSGLCPFHKEKTPSFIVSPDIQRYKCFGCGVSGDIFNFVQDIENIDFVEALEKLSKVAGVELKKSKTNTKFKEIKDINYIATKYYYNNLLKDESAMNYVLSRGINRDSIKKFALGYSPKNSSLLSQIKKSGNYSKKAIMDSGLFVERNGQIKEKFFDRIMFPIRSRRGDVIGFTARQNAGNTYGPKYMNTPETPVFHKSNNLFGQYEARQEIRKQDLAIICEGSTDVISAYQYGFKNIVAPLGTSLTTPQLESIINITKNVLFFFDNDSAGQAALTRAFVLASQLGMNPYAATPAPYKDIDELLQKKPEKLTQAINKKKEAFSFILSNLLEGRNIRKLADISSIKKIITPILDSVKDKDTQRLYATKLEEITKIQYNKVRQEQKVELTKQELGEKEQESKSTLQSEYIQHLLFLDNIETEYLIDKKFISNKDLLILFTLIIKNRNKVSRSQLFSEIEKNDDAQSILEEMIFNIKNLPQDQDGIKKELKSIIRMVKIDYYKNLQKELSSQVAMSEELEDDEKSKKALDKLQRITKIINSIKNE